MKRQTAKQKVQAVYPNAIAIEDIGISYPSEWAMKAKFAVGFFKVPMDIDSNKIYETTYQAITTTFDWEFLCGWKENPTAAWKAAWESIGDQMISKLEQQ